MKNMNRFVLSISACLMIALTHASVEEQAFESRMLKKLRARQQELQFSIAQELKDLTKTSEEFAEELVVRGTIRKDQLDQVLISMKDPINIKLSYVEEKLQIEKRKSQLVSVNEQIRLLTKKEPTATFTQLKELLQKRDKKEEQRMLSRNWTEKAELRAELNAVDSQIAQLTTTAEAKAEVEAAQKQRDEAFKNQNQR